MMETETEIAGGHTAMESTVSPTQPLAPIHEVEGVTASVTTILQSNYDVHIFNKDADLTFKLKTELGHVEYKVNKFNIASASDIFGRLVFEENSGLELIELPDKPVAFAVLMNIVHYQFSLVPKQPSIDELFEICLLVSKYDCTHLIEPWADRWTAVLTDFVGNDLVSKKNFKALWVAWVLGCVAPFREMVDSLILTSSVDNSGDLVHSSGPKLKDLLLPHGLLGKFPLSLPTY
jgi:hypothetical protein